jgi:hypothetical protein
LTDLFKKLRLRQLLTVFLAGLLLIVSTACSPGGATNAQGARPNNPSVQAGGSNNPYKNGGDNYTDLNMSTDPKVSGAKAKSGRDHASLQLDSQLLIATNKDSGLLYPGAETPEGRAQKEAELPIKTAKDFQKPEPGGLIQRQSDVGERMEDRIETVTEAIQDASSFLQDKADEAFARPEFQPNPALHSNNQPNAALYNKK